MLNKLVILLIAAFFIAVVCGVAFQQFYGNEYALVRQMQKSGADMTKPQSLLANISPVSKTRAEEVAEKFKGQPGVEIFVKELYMTQYMPNDWQCLIRRRIEPSTFVIHDWKKEIESKIGPVFSLQWENIHRSLLD